MTDISVIEQQGNAESENAPVGSEIDNDTPTSKFQKAKIRTLGLVKKAQEEMGRIKQHSKHVDEESQRVDEISEEIEKLTEDTASLLGVNADNSDENTISLGIGDGDAEKEESQRVKKGSSVRKYVAGVQEIGRGKVNDIAEKIDKDKAWEHIRKPQLIKMFTEAGFENPEKAVTVVKFLEERLHYTDTEYGDDGKVRKTTNIPWHFQQGNLESIRLITSGVDDPITFLNKFQNVIELPNPYYLEDFSEYVNTIKNSPRLQEFLDILPTLGPIRGFDYYLRFPKNGDFETVDGGKIEDPLIKLLNLEENEFNQIFSPESIQWMRDFNLRQIDRSLEYRKTKDKEANPRPVLPIESLKDLARIGADENLQKMFAEYLDKNLSNVSMYRGLYEEVTYFSHFQSAIPEAKQLFALGFDISPYYRNMYGGDFRTNTLYERKDDLKRILENPVYRKNAQILSQYGYKVQLFEEFGHFPSELLYRTESSDILEKALKISALAQQNTDVVADDEEVRRHIIRINSLVIRVGGIPENALIDDLVGNNGEPTIELFNLAITRVDEGVLTRGVINTILKDGPIDGMTKEDKAFWNYYAETDNLYLEVPNIILRNRNNPEYFQHGLPTPAFIEKVFSEDAMALNVVDHLIPFELLDQFSAEDKIFWKTILKYNDFDLRTYIYRQRNQFDEYFQNGLPTTKLLYNIGESSMQRDHLFSKLLTEEAIDAFPDEEKEFWKLYKGDGSNSLHNYYFRNVLLKDRDRFSEFYVDGEITPILIEELVKVHRSALDTIELHLTDDVLGRFSGQDQEFWRCVRDVKHAGLLRHSLYDFRDKFEEYVVDGTIQPTFFEDVVLTHRLDVRGIKSLLTPEQVDAFPDKDQSFWKYILNLNPGEAHIEEIAVILFDNRAIFNELIQDGQKTDRFFELIAQDAPHIFISSATKEHWKTVIGQQKLDELLATLPTQTDERRNAFTHNQYDRTTQFLQIIERDENSEFAVTPEEIDVVTQYIKNFGLSRTPQLYSVYRDLYRYESGLTNEIPERTAITGIRSTTELMTRISTIRELAFSAEPLKDMSKFNEFDTLMLDVITGRSTHSHQSRFRPDMSTIIRDFTKDFANGEITPLPDGYEPFTLEIQKPKVEMDLSAIAPDFYALKDELDMCNWRGESIDDLREMMSTVFQKRMEIISAKLTDATEGAKAYMEKELATHQEYAIMIQQVTDIDTLVTTLVDMKVSKEDKKAVNTVLRQAIFRKINIKNPDFVYLALNRMNEISIDGVFALMGVIDEAAKEHALNLNRNNEEGYWTEEAFEKLKSSKNGRRLSDVFNPHAGNIRAEISNMETEGVGDNIPVSVIPDRGLIGEMAGYLANACYTAEYPLLKRYPDVTPYKFIADSGVEGKKFVGSVLVFETTDDTGSPVLLVRALNIPQEEELNMEDFIEKFLDKMGDLAETREKSKVLVPGAAGTISNYAMTNRHIRANYVIPELHQNLRDEFDFNHYNITNNCYIARTVENSENQ